MNNQQIRTIREQLGLSQREFADKLDVKRLAIARWESGTRTPDEANQRRILQIAKENGLDTNFISKELDTNSENVSNKVDTKNQIVSNEMDTKSKFVSSNDEIVSSLDTKLDTKMDTGYKKVDTLDTNSQNVSSKMDTNLELGYNLDTKLDTKLYYETMYQNAKGIIPLCIITQPQDSDQKPSLQVKGFYEIPQIPSLLAEADRLNGDYHIYTGIHPLRERPSEGRGKEKDIVGIALFAADVDAKDFIDDPVDLSVPTPIPKVLVGTDKTVEKQKANEERAFYRWTDELLSECKAKALMHIRSVCERVSLPPTAIIDSGHGYYPIFKLDKFVEFEGDQHREELKKLNKALHEVFSADSTFDFARILRVPGTRNIKPGYPTECKLIEFHPELRYTLDDIRRFEKLIELPLEKPKAKVEGVVIDASHPGVGEPCEQSKPKPQAVFLDDQELIEKAKNAKDGVKFSALWDGDFYEYKSQSEADLALCCLLAFWTGGDYERIDRLFRQSGLYREDKWGEREDYRERTINAALSQVNEFYDPNGKKSDTVQFTVSPSALTPRSAQANKAEASPEILFTDGWNAKRFVREHGKDVRYCYEWGKWLTYDGKRWTIDNTGEVIRRAKQTIKRLYAQAAETDNDIERKLLADHAKKSDSNYKYKALLELAECEVPILTKDLDTNQMLFNVENGTLDLRTGELREHRREDFITKLAPMNYGDANASCPKWLSFLGRIMNNNANLIEFLQRAVGYALTGDISEQSLFFLYGTGANGKTVFLETIKGMLGDYAKEAEPEILIQKRNEAHPTGVADLFGARFVATTEVGEGRRMDETKVKQLTGGDRLKARFMRQDFFEFYPTHKIFLAANHKPIIRGTDLAIWRRIRLIPFEVVIPEPERIPLAKMLAMLKLEWPGILAWAVRGCLAWQKNGMGLPQEVEQATQAYRDEMDVLTDFFDECCVIHENACVNSAKLWNAYLAWTKEQYPLGRRAFSNRLTARGFINEQAKIAGQNQRIWRGVGLAVEPDTKYEEGVI